MNKLAKFYNSIQLNLGIKNTINQLFFAHLYLDWLDNHILFPIHTTLEKYFFRRIVAHYGADYRWGDEKSQNLDTKNFNFGYGNLHYALIRNQKPKRILCIGSMYGFIPYMMARACRDNQYGHVDFVDAGYDLANKKDQHSHYFGQGFWIKPAAKNHFSYLGVNKYLTTYVMTNEEFAKKHHYQYDYIYLDADRSYQGTLLNLQLFWPKLRQEGLVCFHGIHFDQVIKGVVFEHGKVWKRLSKMPFKLEVSNHHTGIGIIQKITDDNPLDYL